MRIDDFDYYLPEELIAQEPLSERTSSRMMIVDRSTDSLSDGSFSDLGTFLKWGDTLVLNNTKVFPARLLGTTDTGARVELFLIREMEDGLWESLGRPAKRMRPGKKVVFGNGFSAEVAENQDGRVKIRFDSESDLQSMLERFGKTPLPPYIKRKIASPDTDRERYQTVFAKNRGAIAAPTAGLHFSPEALAELNDSGITLCEITLHVGYGTFEPVRAEDLADHRVLPEEYEIEMETAEILNRALSEKRRIVAVGTTTARTLETEIRKNGDFEAGKGCTDLTITPGYRFKAIDALLTNFHLPRSSLLVLVSTFAGHDLTMRAYRRAVESRYRFFSYGDCMLII